MLKQSQEFRVEIVLGKTASKARKNWKSKILQLLKTKPEDANQIKILKT